MAAAREEPNPYHRALTDDEWTQLENAAGTNRQLVSRLRLREERHHYEQEEAYRNRRLNVFLVVFGLLASMVFPSVLTWVLEVGANADPSTTPVATSSSSSTSPGGSSPTVAPTQLPSTSPTSPVVVNYAGTEAPVVVVMQPPAESSGVNWPALVTAISGGVVAILAAAGFLTAQTKRRPGDPEPATPTVPGT